MAIFKRGKKYCCVTYAGRVDGRERQRWKTFATRGEAETWEARQTLDGPALAPARLTVGEYLGVWIEHHRARPQSIARYRSAMKNHLVPGIGHIRLSKLGPAVLEDFIHRQEDAGYAPATIRHNLFVLNTALNRAFKQRVITINPMSLIDLPQLGERIGKPWDTEQVRLFLGAVRRSPFHALLIVTVATGLRSCEVRALREEDYDPPHLRIRRKVRRVRGAWIFDDYLKTKAGGRVVTLPPFAQAALAEVLTGKGGPLFRSALGEPFHAQVIQDELDRLAKEARIPRIRFHDLRHTQGTVLANVGLPPQVIQRRLGHARIGITMDLYAHETPGADAPAADVLEQFFGDGKSSEAKR